MAPGGCRSISNRGGGSFPGPMVNEGGSQAWLQQQQQQQQQQQPQQQQQQQQQHMGIVPGDSRFIFAAPSAAGLAQRTAAAEPGLHQGGGSGDVEFLRGPLAAGVGAGISLSVLTGVKAGSAPETAEGVGLASVAIAGTLRGTYEVLGSSN